MALKIGIAVAIGLGLIVVCYGLFSTGAPSGSSTLNMALLVAKINLVICGSALTVGAALAAVIVEARGQIVRALHNNESSSATSTATGPAPVPPQSPTSTGYSVELGLGLAIAGGIALLLVLLPILYGS